MKRRVIKIVTLLSLVYLPSVVMAAPFHSSRRPVVVKPGPVIGHRAPRVPAGARRIVIAGVVYWVDHGVYYTLSGKDYMIVKAPRVKVLPKHHRVVVINRKVYYVADDVYYTSTVDGYVVIEKPVEEVMVSSGTDVAVAPSSQTVPLPVAPKTITIYAPKVTKGGFVPVTLTKLEGGYLGPQGEFYPVMPLVDQLTQMYGVDERMRETVSNGYVIYVPKKSGDGYVRIELIGKDQGYVGPQGEFYPAMPRVAQLTAMYGCSIEPVKVVGDEVVIRIPKKDGQGQAEVTLKKQGDGYVGPQGEYYPELPTVVHLTEIYEN